MAKKKKKNNDLTPQADIELKKVGDYFYVVVGDDDDYDDYYISAHQDFEGRLFLEICSNIPSGEDSQGRKIFYPIEYVVLDSNEKLITKGVGEFLHVRIKKESGTAPPEPERMPKAAAKSEEEELAEEVADVIAEEAIPSDEDDVA